MELICYSRRPQWMLLLLFSGNAGRDKPEAAQQGRAGRRLNAELADLTALCRSGVRCQKLTLIDRRSAMLWVGPLTGTEVYT